MSGMLHKVPTQKDYVQHGRVLLGTLDDTLKGLSSLGGGEYSVREGRILKRRPLLGFFGVSHYVPKDEERDLSRKLAMPIREELEGVRHAWGSLKSMVENELAEFTELREGLEDQLRDAYGIIQSRARDAVNLTQEVREFNPTSPVEVLDPSYVDVMMQKYLGEKEHTQKTHLANAKMQAKNAGLGLAELMLGELADHNAYYNQLLCYSEVVGVFCKEANFLVDSTTFRLAQAVSFWELAYDSAAACKGREHLAEITDSLKGVFEKRKLGTLQIPTSKMIRYDD